MKKKVLLAIVYSFTCLPFTRLKSDFSLDERPPQVAGIEVMSTKQYAESTNTRQNKPDLVPETKNAGFFSSIILSIASFFKSIGLSYIGEKISAFIRPANKTQTTPSTTIVKSSNGEFNPKKKQSNLPSLLPGKSNMPPLDVIAPIKPTAQNEENEGKLPDDLVSFPEQKEQEMTESNDPVEAELKNKQESGEISSEANNTIEEKEEKSNQEESKSDLDDAKLESKKTPSVSAKRSGSSGSRSSASESQSGAKSSESPVRSSGNPSVGNTSPVRHTNYRDRAPVMNPIITRQDAPFRAQHRPIYSQPRVTINRPQVDISSLSIEEQKEIRRNFLRMGRSILGKNDVTPITQRLSLNRQNLPKEVIDRIISTADFSWNNFFANAIADDPEVKKSLLDFVILVGACEAMNQNKEIFSHSRSVIKQCVESIKASREKFANLMLSEATTEKDDLLKLLLSFKIPLEEKEAYELFYGKEGIFGDYIDKKLFDARIGYNGIASLYYVNINLPEYNLPGCIFANALAKLTAFSNPAYQNLVGKCAELKEELFRVCFHKYSLFLDGGIIGLRMIINGFDSSFFSEEMKQGFIKSLESVAEFNDEVINTLRSGRDFSNYWAEASENIAGSYKFPYHKYYEITKNLRENIEKLFVPDVKIPHSKDIHLDNPRFFAPLQHNQARSIDSRGQYSTIIDPQPPEIPSLFRPFINYQGDLSNQNF